MNSEENNDFIVDLFERLGGKCRVDDSDGKCKRYYFTHNKDVIIKWFNYFEIKNKEEFNVEKILNTNKEFIMGLIDGLISSDGNVNLSGRYPLIRFVNTSKKLHFLLKHLLLFTKADYKLYKKHDKDKKFKINERTITSTKDCFEGIIDNDSILNLFNEIKYFSNEKKNEKFENIIKSYQLNGVKWKTKIKKIEYIGNDVVYDLYEPNADDWNHEGYVSRGCGEVPGDPDFTTVCLLGSINLTQYVYIENNISKFDFKQYKEDIRIFTRMLDNVCDIMYLPLPAYENSVKKLRQIGIGINGLGSTLMMLKIPYSSKNAKDFVTEIQKLKENLTIQESALLAKEKGCFELFDREKYVNTSYFKSDRLTKETKELVKKYGIRNAKTTTNPPCGTTSLLCDYVSNGIEPVFSLETQRKIIVDKWPDGLTIDNIKRILSKKEKKNLVYWEGKYNEKKYYYEPHNRGLCEINILKDYGYRWLQEKFDIKKSDDYIITTNDLNVDNHIDIQSIIQYYNNQAVSKTINIPKNYSFKDFKDVYIKAWKKGIVGVTTYREGSMESVVESFKLADEKKEIIKSDIKLPDNFINGEMKKIKGEGVNFYLHFSYLPDDNEMNYPIAMWIHTNAKKETIACNRACKILAKKAEELGIKKKIIEDVWDKSLDDLAHNRLGRFISLCLRHNIPREQIYLSLSNVEGNNISTLLTAIKKFIGETIEDGTKITDTKCTECKSDNIILQSGCFVCLDCGNSLCGS